MPTFATDDHVIVNPRYAKPRHRGVVYRVTAVLPVNIDVVPLTGGRVLRAHPDMFLPAPPAGGAVATIVDLLPPVLIWPGSIVTVTGPRWKEPADLIWVVLRDKGDTASIAKAGGDEGRYYPRVPVGYLTVVDPARISITAPAT